MALRGSSAHSRAKAKHTTAKKHKILEIAPRTVSITRALQPGSPFREKMEGAGWVVHGQSLIRFRCCAPPALPEADWLFFYSPRGADCLSRLHPSPAGYRMAAVGPGTAAAMQRHGWLPDFTGTGRPGETAEAFAQEASGHSVAFVQAKRSRQSVQKALGGRVAAQSVVAYDNEAAPPAEQWPSAAIVFTSPMSARTYFSVFPLLPGQRAFAIGQPTKDALASLGVAAPQAERPDEEAMAQMVLAALL